MKFNKKLLMNERMAFVYVWQRHGIYFFELQVPRLAAPYGSQSN